MQKEVILVQADKPQQRDNIADTLIQGADISTIVTGIAAIVGVVIAWYQLGRVVDNLKLQKQEIELGLERTKRENAVNHALRWTSLPLEVHSASRIAENLNEKDTKKLLDFEEMVIEKKNLNFLKDIFGEDYQFIIENDKVKLTIKEVKKLRYYVNYWINTLESIFIAYRYDIADKKILGEEFEGMVFNNKNKFILENIFEGCGSARAFPGIADFISDFEKKAEEKHKSPESLSNKVSVDRN